MLQISEAYKAAIQSGSSPEKFEMPFPYLSYHEGYIPMDFSCQNPEQLLLELEELGMKNPSVFKHMISGLFPVENIDQLQTCKYLINAHGAYCKMQIGSVTSQGDDAMRTQTARRALRLRGQGTKVGVLSDSYDALNGAEAGIISGDLPGAANPFGNTSEVEALLDDLNPNNIDEGRAMFEIVHDVAPKAELAFHTAFLGQASFANGISLTLLLLGE